jgi:hypothetical protein
MTMLSEPFFHSSIRKAIVISFIAASFIITTRQRSEANDIKRCLHSLKNCREEVENPFHHARPITNKFGDSVVDAAKAQVSTTVHIVRIAGGRESLSDGVKQSLAAQGVAVVELGEAGSSANAEISNAADSAIQNVAGKRVGAILSIGVDTTRVVTEFGTTAVIGAGETLQGKLDPKQLIALPLAAAIRAAQQEFLPRSLPLPSFVKVALSPDVNADLLNNARWTVGSLAIDLPDLTNAYVRKYQGGDNAVTVGNVTVFSTDPGGNYHWWFHELYHQGEYHDWGIDKFAYNYVTACRTVEWNAEKWAQAIAPYLKDNFNPPCP